MNKKMNISVDFAKAPFLVIWETTRSCALACNHCRASAEHGRDPRELTTDEGKRLMDQAASMGTPVFILSGGDPLERSDLEELVSYGDQKGLRMGTIPAATSNLTRERLAGLKEAGLAQLAFSIDGPTAALHDSFRNTPGAFTATMKGIEWAHELGLPLQINTCLARWNYGMLEDLVALVRSLDIVFWEVFFLIPVGRGKDMGGLAPAEFEAVFERMATLTGKEKFVVKLTEAQHYKRFLSQRAVVQSLGSGWAHGRIGASPQAVNAGKGFAFVSHVGDIQPSGFLPITAGNVRTHSLVDVYRDSKLFRELRDPQLLKGKCHGCEFDLICGGSRSRAAAMIGDYLAPDPSCSYIP